MEELRKQYEGFIENVCGISDSNKIKLKDLYEAYVEYANRTGIPCDSKSVFSAIIGKLFRKTNCGGVYVHGIAVMYGKLHDVPRLPRTLPQTVELLTTRSHEAHICPRRNNDNTVTLTLTDDDLGIIIKALKQRENTLEIAREHYMDTHDVSGPWNRRSIKLMIDEPSVHPGADRYIKYID